MSPALTLTAWSHASPVTGTVLRGWCSAPSGKPLLHVLHGNGFCGRVYEPLLQHLAADFDLWLCDAPGHGDSDPAPRFPGWNTCADAALEAFQAGRGRFGDVPCFALGHSFGGVQTALLLAEPGQPFARAALLDPVLFPPPMLLTAQLIGRVGSGLANPLARATRRRRREWPSRDDARERLRGRGTYRGWTEAALDAFVTHALRDTPEGQVALKCSPELESTIFSTMPQQLWSRLRRIAVPTLLVHGVDTMPFVKVGCGRAHRHNPSHLHVQVTAGGHCFMQEDPADAAARVRAHLLG
ncbi:alpha/beta fold hydrolase [Roseateles sp. BYS87W]|uniref:Alpha/beta fold hydrolase n=1 Tax=Pelomonas baiyunensis TaxID=3299026 RepID=A0ABW7H1T8_9BURK